MGGNALNFKTRRVDKKEFYELDGEVCDIFRKLYPNSKFLSLEGGFEDKADFGDLDVIVCNNLLDKYSFATIKEALGSKDYNLNSNTWSFDYKDFQVDFVFMDPEHYESSISYYSKGDLGNLLGRLFHKFGLKFGHKGLSYIIRHGNYPFAEIILTKDIKKALQFLGLDWMQYHNGFATANELYNYVASSKYFNPDIFLFDNQNHHNKVRDRKRPMYCNFLKWCAEQDNLTHFEFPENKEDWFLKIESYFPGFLAQLDHYKRQIDRVEHFKTLYNGALVSELTGLVGKDLGQFMAYVREKEGDKETFMQKVFDLDQNGVKVLVLEHYKLFTNNIKIN